MAPMNRLQEGLTVNSIDGRRIGVVAAVGDECLWIRIGSGPDVCIAEAAVLAIEPWAISLVCLPEGLTRYRR